MSGMNDDRRNAYVLLGLPYGASLSEAKRAFARRAREARWGDRNDTDLSDLEWALSRLELEQSEPAAAFGTYRVPADPGVLRAPAGFGLLAPAPRSAPRRSPVTPDEERDVVFDAARLDAAQHLLDRTSAAAGRKLERISDVPLPVVSVPVMPVRRRGWAPVIMVGAVALAVLAIAGISALTGSDDDTDEAPATTAVAVETSAAATTEPATSAPATTAAFGSEPGLGEPIEVGGIEITPSDPIDGFGHLCLIFTIDGDVPLGFIRENVTLISGGVAYEPALGVNTGRALGTDVFGDPAPAQREICFPMQGWQDQNTDLVYATQAGNYRWSIGT
jgi:hypothetical protein